jgi:type I restriction enzyme S subunit
MSKLEQIIAELCPDGVEYKTLGEIATNIYRGLEIKRDQVTKIETPCVRYGEIYTTYNIWLTDCVSHTDENAIIGKNILNTAMFCSQLLVKECRELLICPRL